MRCRCCNTPLIGNIRTTREIDGTIVEDDFCTRCIYETEVLDYVYIKTYQFEDITEKLFGVLSIKRQ